MPKSLTARLLIVAGGGILIFLLVQALLDGGDDDRPPIIVNNGTVVLEAQPDGDGDRGKFKDDFFGDQWRHSHSKKAPKIFEVTVENASNCTTPSVQPYKIKELEVTYGNGGTSSTVRIYVGGFPGFKHLKIDFGDATPVQAADHVLQVGGQGDRIQSVKLGPGGSATVCQFDAGANARITIAQKHSE